MMLSDLSFRLFTNGQNNLLDANKDNNSTTKNIPLEARVNFLLAPLFFPVTGSIDLACASLMAICSLATLGLSAMLNQLARTSLLRSTHAISLTYLSFIRTFNPTIEPNLSSGSATLVRQLLKDQHTFDYIKKAGLDMKEVVERPPSLIELVKYLMLREGAELSYHSNNPLKKLFIFNIRMCMISF